MSLGILGLNEDFVQLNEIIVLYIILINSLIQILSIFLLILRHLEYLFL